MSGSTLLLTPPVVLTLLAVLVGLLLFLAKPLAYRRRGERGALDKPYAGGENLETHRVQTDYSQFFPFAFFFTILHVVTLMVATSPPGTLSSDAFAGLYVLGALLALFVLFRR